MIVVTGAVGFIGSCLVEKLNLLNLKNIVVVDDFSNHDKNKNLAGKFYSQAIDRSNFILWLENNYDTVSIVYHLGARTDTTEFDYEILEKLNENFSKSVWTLCAKHDIPMIYASSAATYGLGEFSYDDNHALVNKLNPLNPYGKSKNNFDKWVLSQQEGPSFWVGFKFFNVYGPNEYHKKRMASVILHAYKQIKDTGQMNLFKSHNPNYKDGEQLRDFVYVKDVIEILSKLVKIKISNGIYNLGTGVARSFNDLVNITFSSLGLTANINFIDTPKDIRDKYQYFTQANMKKLNLAGIKHDFMPLEEGVSDYVKNYLLRNRYF